MKTTARQKPILLDIATRNAISHNTIALLPNPDPILKKANKNITAYRDLLSDPHVGGCVRRRKATVKAKDRQVVADQADKAVVDFIEDVFSKLDIEKLVSEAMDAALFGYQPVEITWSLVDGKYWPTAAQSKPPEWFCFDPENKLRFRTKERPNEGVEVPDGKFIVFSQDATYDNPYGIADLSKCFWPTQFKRGGFKFWITFCERYGSPWLVGKHPRGTAVSETDQMLERLEGMIQDAVAVIPDDSSIDIVEATGKAATSDVYEKLLFYCRSEIAIAILGQNQTTEATANLASAKAGGDVTKDISESDAKMVMSGINHLIRLIVQYNFGDVPAPKYEIIEPEDVDIERANRDKILFDCGVNLSKDYYKQHYGLQDKDFDEEKDADDAQKTAVEPPFLAKNAIKQPLLDEKSEKQAAFAENSPADYQQAIDDSLGKKTLENLKAAFAEIANPIVTKLQACKTEAEAMAVLEDENPDMPIEQVVELMEAAIFKAQLLGGAEVAKELSHDA